MMVFTPTILAQVTELSTFGMRIYLDIGVRVARMNQNGRIS